MRGSKLRSWLTVWLIAIPASDVVADDPSNTAAGEYVIQGTCRSPDQTPIAEVRVELYIAQSRTVPVELLRETRSDENGEFRFEGLKAPKYVPQREEYRRYAVVASAPDLATRVDSVSRPSDDSLDLVLSSAATLKGRVINEAGAPVPNAIVFRSSVLGQSLPGITSALSDIEGRFAITDIFRFKTQFIEVGDPDTLFTKLIPRSQIVCQVEHPDYGNQPFTIIEAPATIEVVLREPAIIEGIVFDDVTQLPARNVRVVAHAVYDETYRGEILGGGETVTDDEGRYRLLLIPDYYNIWASMNDRTVDALKSFEAKAGANLAADLKMIAGGYIEGRLIDSDGQPVTSSPSDPISIGVHGPARPFNGSTVQATTVEEDGTFLLRVPPGKNYP
ncbi:MAG: carboxypeptidase regulatory-like domain-containing protein, partial [Planctomycetaceae bacterium]|nr:carboxypeptidase regulatory-like domain-containing protein [Planctomycetaceae bacterium]